MKNYVLKSWDNIKRKKIQIAERIIGWIFYTIFISVFPMITYIGFNELFELGVNQIKQYITDYCTITIIMSATTIRDIVDSRFWRKGQFYFMIVLEMTLMIITVVAILYGGVEYGFLSGVEMSDMVNNKILSLVKLFAKISIGINFTIQFLIIGENNESGT